MTPAVSQKLIVLSVTLLSLTSGAAFATAQPFAAKASLSLSETFGTLPEATEIARRGRGKDDAPGDDRGGRGRGKDDGAGHAALHLQIGDEDVLARRGRGKDDAPGDDRGGRGRGKDDGAGHA
jgi:hypothetical protein